MKRLHRFLLLGLLCLSPQLQAASYEVTDSFGKHRFETPPSRVVVTDWTLLENLLELGVTPIGAPELDGYRKHVGTPALSEDITDIGLRQAPSLRTLKALKPDLIILGTGQKDLARPFSRISRVAYYKFFSDRYRTNGKKASVRFLQMAELFQKTELAEQKLAEMEAAITPLHESEPLTIARQSGDELIAYGPNSLVGHAMTLLGLTNAQSFKGNSWGEETLTGQDIAGRFLVLENVWPYGGALSIGRIAQAISAQLAANAR